MQKMLAETGFVNSSNLVRCGLFIYDFAYLRFSIILFLGTILQFIVIFGLFVCEFFIFEPNFKVPILIPSLIF